jgi:hypothetical protein
LATGEAGNTLGDNGAKGGLAMEETRQTGGEGGIVHREDGDDVLVVGGTDVWGFVDMSLAELHPAGWQVHATDGEIGKVDRASNEPGSTYLVIDTGTWIFGKTVVIPAGLVERADPDTETVYVNCSKDDIKNAPEYDQQVGVSDAYRRDLGSYYETRGTMPHDETT